jgi:hypothetical protein
MPGAAPPPAMSHPRTAPRQRASDRPDSSAAWAARGEAARARARTTAGQRRGRPWCGTTRPGYGPWPRCPGPGSYCRTIPGQRCRRRSTADGPLPGRRWGRRRPTGRRGTSEGGWKRRSGGRFPARAGRAVPYRHLLFQRGRPPDLGSLSTSRCVDAGDAAQGRLSRIDLDQCHSARGRMGIRRNIKLPRRSGRGAGAPCGDER